MSSLLESIYRPGVGLVLGMVLGIALYLPLAILVGNILFVAVGPVLGFAIGNAMESYIRKKLNYSGHFFGSQEETSLRLYIIVGISLSVLVAVLIYILHLRPSA